MRWVLRLECVEGFYGVLQGVGFRGFGVYGFGL